MLIPSTGLYHVSKIKNYQGKKHSHRYVYRIKNELFDVGIYAVDILKLKQRVIEAGFVWAIVDKDLALETANEAGVNPMDLNSNINPKYIKTNFSPEEFSYCVGCNLCYISGNEECRYDVVDLKQKMESV